jgi:hypothetical protein
MGPDSPEPRTTVLMRASSNLLLCSALLRTVRKKNMVMGLNKAQKARMAAGEGQQQTTRPDQYNSTISQECEICS